MIIYKITNLLNSKVYIGQTSKSLEERWKQHQRNLQKGIKYHLYNAIRKYGINNFNIETIDNVKLSLDLSKKEIFWIKYYNAANRKFGYNGTLGGEGGSPTKETRLKISKSRKGVKPKEGTGIKISISLLNYWKIHTKAGPSLEMKKRISETLKTKGCKPPLHIMKGTDHPMFGKHHSREVKQLLSTMKQGKKIHSVEEKQIRSKKWLANGNPNYIFVDKNLLIVLIKKGLFAKDIAGQLNISIPTVFSKIKELLDISSLTEARKLL